MWNSSLQCFSVFGMILASFYLLYNIFLTHRKPHIMSFESMAFGRNTPMLHAIRAWVCTSHEPPSLTGLSVAGSLIWERKKKVVNRKYTQSKAIKLKKVSYCWMHLDFLPVSWISQRDQDSAKAPDNNFLFLFCLINIGEMFRNCLDCKTHKLQLGICLLSRINVISL